MERRLFLLNAARLAAAASAIAPAAVSNAAGYPFSLGAASGSPLPDSAILWTRILHDPLPDPLNATSSPPLAVPLRREVSHDEAARVRFMGLDEVRDPDTPQRVLAASRVADGKTGVEMA